MNRKSVIVAQGYNRVDGRNAYSSKIKELTLGAPILDENKIMQIALQLWKEDGNGMELGGELSIHQVMDMMILLSKTLLYFKEAYRYPLMYDPENPVLDRIGLQGDAVTMTVDTQNPDIDSDVVKFAQSLNDLGEITGERLRVLSKILEELVAY